MMAPDACEKIDYWMKRGLAGLRLFTAGSTMEGQGDWLADPRSFPAWEHAQKLGIPMCLQMRKAGLQQLDALLKNFPKTRIIIDHLMKPAIEDGPPYPGAQFVLELARYPNIYLKLTTNNVRDARKGKATPGTFFPMFVKAFGASRIAWGSNCPASAGTLPEMVQEAKAVLACLSSSDQEWIFAKTAQSLYPVLAD
jgi:L-fuconolactonase